MLVSLQSHAEVLNSLDSAPEFKFTESGEIIHPDNQDGDDSVSPKIFVASVSPQVRASIAATYGLSQQQAGYLIEQFFSGPNGLRTGGKYGNGFSWIVDTNVMRDVCLELTTQEVAASLQKAQGATSSDDDSIPNKPVLASSCPGWVCYAEKTHPYVLPHMSRMKSPQALTGTLLKTVLSKRLNIPPSQIWHLSLMPCFDKKLEASRAELTDMVWSGKTEGEPVRDVDCVITSRELLMLADTRGLDLRRMPTRPLPSTHRTPFPDSRLSSFLFPKNSYSSHGVQVPDAGTSGGYLYHLLTSQQRLNPGTQMVIQRGRNADVVEYSLVDPDGTTIIKAARYYGFRNIQNLVRKLKPPKVSRLLGAARKIPASEARAVSRRPVKAATAGTTTSLTEYAYVEVMACPGGCTNGGGQIRAEDAKAAVSKPAITAAGESENQEESEQPVAPTPKPSEQRAWLAQVDAAYYDADSAKDTELEKLEEEFAALSVEDMLSYWTELSGVPLSKLTKTTYNAVESDVGKKSKGDTARVAEIAGKIGGGW